MTRAPALLVTAAVLGLGSLTAAPPPAGAAAPVAAASTSADRLITYTQWDTGRQLRTGTRAGLRISHGRLVLAGGTATRRYRGTTYDVGTWTSPASTPGYGVTQLVASWSATTPRGSWIEVRTRATGATTATTTGTTTGHWQVLGRWASGDRHVRRTSVPGQSDALGRVDVDTWDSATAAGATSYQLQVRLMRRHGSSAASPTLDTVGAVASRLPDAVPGVSAPGAARGVVLPVPAYSQMTHRGEFAQYGGGGEAWCSPTSTSMVLGYYGRLPSAASYAWAGAHADAWVDQAARRTYDAAYQGTGNWPFNTAYAASQGLHAFVTRLRSLAEAEQLVAAGIPVVISVSFSGGALSGAPISSTAGHLLVVVGFTDTGDVVVNDPAAPTDATVRRVYDRAQLEAAWLGGSGGTAYVVHDDAHPLPASPGDW